LPLVENSPIFAPEKRYKKVPLCNIRGGTTGTGKTNHSLPREVLPRSGGEESKITLPSQHLEKFCLRSGSWGIGALCIKNEREKEK